MNKYANQMMAELDKLLEKEAERKGDIINVSEDDMEKTAIYDRKTDDPAEKYHYEDVKNLHEPIVYDNEEIEAEYKKLLKSVMKVDPREFDDIEKAKYEKTMERIMELENMLDEGTVAEIRDQLYSKFERPEKLEKYLDYTDKLEKENLPDYEERFASILSNLSKLATKLDAEGNLNAADEIDKAIKNF